MDRTLLKEHFALEEAIERLVPAKDSDIELVIKALLRRLKVEKRVRKYNRIYKRMRKQRALSKQQKE